MTKRVLAILSIVILLITIFPVSAFADPVTATVIANSFAQAITAYGAANGVSMVFDVQNTSGIGETVHDLWTKFRTSTQTADDYDTLAATLFPDLYYKAEVVATGVGLANYVGVHISDTFAEYFDDFYNWLLSGPAQLVQVDNQYYEFGSSQIGPESVPIEVVALGGSFGNQPIAKRNSFSTSIPVFFTNPAYSYNYRYYTTANNPCYVFLTFNGSQYSVVVASQTYGTQYYECRDNQGNKSQKDITSSSNGLYYNSSNFLSSVRLSDIVVPVYANIDTGISALKSWIASPTYDNTLGVQSSDDTGIADFPDTDDPNYDATHRAKDIPLDQPWDDTIYGDGTDDLTETQSAAITNIISQVIEQEKVIEIVHEMEMPDVPELSEVFIPLLPVSLPSFNFSLSGIWHYVRDWVTSISAFLSLTTTVWGWLPYAIYLPVYASLVIVIVLGIYKRFFM